MKLLMFNAMRSLAIPEKLESERLLLQRLRYEDAEEIFYAYASKSEATRFVSWPTHQSIKDTREFLRYAHRSWRAGIDYSFSIRLKESGRLIGSIGVVNDNGKLQIGYILSPTQWGQGFATEAVRAIVMMLRTLEGVYRIGTFVDVDNVASIHVLEKCGLKREAMLPKWFRFVNQQNEPRDCILFTLE
jgi:[ribosomal protein S5]-alanine N-acetyltransferase